MRKIWLLALAHLKKNREQAVSFFFIILLAAAMINIAFIIMLNYDENYERRARQLNSADVILAIQNAAGGYLDTLENELKADERTAELQKEPVLYFKGGSLYADSTLERNLVVLNRAREQQIGQIAWVDCTEETVENPVWLPWIFKIGGGYETGDVFELTVYTGPDGGEQKMSFHVAGFFEESLLATINSSTTGIVLETEEFQEVSERFGGNFDSAMFSVKLKNHEDNEKYCSEHLPSPPGETALSDAIFYDMVKSARTVTSSIGSMIILAFSAILGAIALIVMKFRIDNSIEEEMPNIGALEAVGYTGKEIAGSIVLQFLTISALGILAGTCVCYAVLPVVSDMFALQTGIIWEQGFDLFSALFAAGIILLSVTAVSFISTGKARRLQPIVALRGGILTHSFKKSALPLEKSFGNLQLLLALKDFRQNARRNILTGVIVAAVSFTVLFACVLYENIAMDFEGYIRSTVGEIFSVRLDAAGPEAARELLAEVKKDEDVRKAFFRCEDMSVMTEEGTQIICYASEAYSEYDGQQLVYEGRFPQCENEAAIGGLIAGKMGRKIGDTVTLKKGGQSAEYLITGFIQGSNYLGRDAVLTEDGYRRISPDYRPVTMVIYLKDGAEAGAFIDGLIQRQGSKIMAAADYKKQLVSSLGSYQQIVGLLTVVVLIISAGVVLLTLYLIIRTMLLKRKKEYGIQKAVGFTTRQLALQSAVSFLPLIFAGAAAGGFCGYFLINPVLSLLFSVIGVMKVSYRIEIWLVASLCMAVTAFGFLLSFLISMRIRRISPCCLIRE